MPFARIGADGTFTALEIREGASGTAVSIGTTGVDCSSVVETDEANCVSMMNNGMTLQCKSLVESAHDGSIDPPVVVEIDVTELGPGTHNLLDYPTGATISLTVVGRYGISNIQNYSTSESIQVEWTSSQTCTFLMPQEGAIITIAQTPNSITKDRSLREIPGDVEIDPVSRASYGEIITITIELDKRLTDIPGKISVTDKGGELISYTKNIAGSSRGIVITITFVMPSSSVNISYK